MNSKSVEEGDDVYDFYDVYEDNPLTPEEIVQQEERSRIQAELAKQLREKERKKILAARSLATYLSQGRPIITLSSD